MINKIRNMIVKVTMLVLMMIMVMPTNVFAEVDIWKDYKEMVIRGIMDQKDPITITFNGTQGFTGEYAAGLEITREYKAAKNNIPTIYSELNIKNQPTSETTTVELNDYKKLISVTHRLDYKNTNADFTIIENELKKQYSVIKTKVTDYEKIEASYHYVIDALSNTLSKNNLTIKDKLTAQGNDAHAVLFSMMMTDLGYENDIAYNTLGIDKWNLVKVHGKWYHVNARLENFGGHNHFLTAKKEEDWDYKRFEDKDEKKVYEYAVEQYEGNPPELPQIKYEVKLITEELGKTSQEIENISKGISIEQIQEAKKEFNVIEAKLESYVKRKEILEAEATKKGLASILSSDFSELDTKINGVDGVKSKIIAKKNAIVDAAVTEAEATFSLVDILAAKEAITMIDDASKVERMNALEKAVVAIINAEKTRTREDYNTASGLVDFLDEGDSKTNLGNRLAIIIAEITAKEKVEVAEQALKDNKKIWQINSAISEAESSIGAIKEEIKLQLEMRIQDIKDSISAIYLVNIAEKSFNNIPDELLTDIISTAEVNIKNAEDKVKDIKDTIVKSYQQKRIVDIKLVLAAIKAVNKAEETINTTNIKSATTAIGKIKILYSTYNGIIAKLNNRISIVDANIVFVEPERLMKAVEVSLKRTDYDKVKIAVDKLKKAGIPYEEQSDKYKELNHRLGDCNNVITAKEAVEEAERLLKANKGKVEEYENVLGKAKGFYDTANKKFDVDNNDKEKEYNERYGDIITDLGIRIGYMDTVIEVINKVNTAEVIYKGYLAGPNTETKVREVVTRAEELIPNINVSFGSVRKSLEGRLKVILDGLIAEGAYNIVNELLKEIEEKETEEDSYVKLIKELSKKDKDLDDAIESLETEIVEIIKLSTNVKVSSQSKDLKDRTTAINDVIAATKAVIIVEEKNENTVSKDITAANNAVEKLRTTGIYTKINGIGDFKEILQGRINKVKDEVDAATNAAKATALVDKAISSKKETDIKVAIEAVAKLNDVETKTLLSGQIEKILTELISDANTTISSVIKSIERNEKSVTTYVTSVRKEVILVENLVIFAGTKLDIINITELNTSITELNTSIEVINISADALKAVQQAEKTKIQADVDTANNTIKEISKDEPYTSMKTELDRRIKVVEKHIAVESATVLTAENLVKAAEDKMGVGEEDNITNPTSTELRTAQDAVNKVTDKTKKADLEKRIDAMNLAIAAKSAVERAEAYSDTTSVKAAEKALDNLVKTNLYSDIVKSLSMRIGELNKELNISKRITEAANLVQKAVESRKQNDITIARDEVEGIKELDNEDDPKNPYKSLKDRLDALEKSIKDEATGESTALETAQGELLKATKEIEVVNTDIAKIIAGGETEKDDIQKAYAKIQVAKNHIIASNSAIRRLIDQNQQKDLLKEIDFVNKEIDLAEDNIDVKEAVRLVTIASSSVMNATTEGGKSEARLDIAAARRAIDKIGHNNNKAIKTTILNTINSIEKKLTSDNDQELIKLAVEEVNKAAELLAKAVRENKVMDPKTQEEIDKAIFAAKMAIGWISDNNKAAKDTLTGFINDIAVMFEAEKDGILNEDRIKNAEKAVAEAESKKGSDQLESYIRSARLRIKMINKDGNPETEVIINDLNTRLDVLEGKGGSSGSNKPGNGGSDKPGTGDSGSNKPGTGGTTPGNKVPTTPLPDKDRFTGSTDPIWGKTNELKKKNPITGLPTYDATAYRVKESIKEITKVSNILKTLPNANAKLVVGGKNISLASKSYIHDKVNNSILVPIKFLGDELGFSVSLIDSPVTKGAKRILINGIVDGKTKSISIDLGSEYYYVNGNLIKASSKALIEGGRTYIPVDLMVEHFGLTFSYSKSGTNIQLIIN